MRIAIGCISLLLVWGAVSSWYWQLISSHDEQYRWLAVLLGFGIMLVIGQIWSLLLNIKKVFISRRPIEKWQDGELVGLSGVIRPEAAPVAAPGSGERAVIVEYDLEREVRTQSSDGSSISYRKDVSGFLMSPCGIYTKRGAVKLLGFPSLGKFGSSRLKDSASLDRAAMFLAKARLQLLTKDPRSIFREMTSVFADADGDVERNFCNSDSPITIVRNSSEDPVKEEDPTRIEARYQEALQDMKNYNYQISERCVKVGSEVTVFGTYKKLARAIDVGAKLTETSHSIQPGELGKVVRRGVVVSVLGLCFWGSLVTVGNYLIVPEARDWIVGQVLSEHAPWVIEYLAPMVVIP